MLVPATVSVPPSWHERLRSKVLVQTTGWWPIAVAAAGPSIPDALVDQLSAGGRLVMPVGRRRGGQHLVRAVRTADGTEVEALLPVTFVPLTGAAGQ